MTRLDANWLKDPRTQCVFDMLANFPTYVVGGCVRNQLMGVSIKDIDLATAAHPDQVVALAKEKNLRVVPTGIEHGTVTVIVEGEPFEVTTFRRDVKTDGRRAVVAFSDSIEDDARRRDFTINAIYADRSGVLSDPVSGLPDIASRRVRFIEDADQRIREDYLRSLRFFRFHAWYGNPEQGLDSDALDAVGRNLAGLETLSRERVGSELLRLLGAPDPAPAVAAMRMTGVLTAILPGADDSALAALVHLERSMELPPDCLRRLTALGGTTNSLRLSREQTSKVEKTRAAMGMPSAVAGYRYGFEIGLNALLITSAIHGVQLQDGALSGVRRGASANFPVVAADLMPTLQGKALGEALKGLEKRWIESDFTLSREALLSKG